LVAETVVEGDLTFNKARINTKANLTMLLPDGAVSLGVNLSLEVTAWECTSVNNGEFDRISVQLAGAGGSGIWFSSDWSGGTTVPQTLDGGKIQVGMTKPKADEADLADNNFSAGSRVSVYPNRGSGPVTFEVEMPGSSGQISQLIYSNIKKRLSGFLDSLFFL